MHVHTCERRWEAVNVCMVMNIKPFSLQSLNIGTHREQASTSTNFLTLTALSAGHGILSQWAKVESIVTNFFAANLGHTVAAAFVL